MCAVPYNYGKVSRREDKSVKWLHPASRPMEKIIWCSFAAGVDVEENVHKKKKKKRKRKEERFDIELALMYRLVEVGHF